MARAMEYSPKTFEDLTEEQIRDFFLVLLNAFFEGESTGETFNKGGNTDILLKYQKNIILIVECKIWRGKKYLFRYTTWRDTKSAIFLFNKEKDTKFSTVLTKIDNIMKDHPQRIENNSFKNKKLNQEGIFSYILKHPDDNQRKIFLSIASIQYS